MRDIQAAVKHLAPEPPSEQFRCPTWWRVIAYLAATLPFLLIVALAWLRPDLNRTEIPDWRPVLALADAAREKGNLYEARHLYLQVERIAAWQQDWEGLLGAACGIKRLDGAARPYSKTHSILIRVMMAAEMKQSRAGIAAVAKAFTTIGETKAESMVLGRIRPDWPEENERSVAHSAECWETR